MFPHLGRQNGRATLACGKIGGQAVPANRQSGGFIWGITGSDESSDVPGQQISHARGGLSGAPGAIVAEGVVG